MEKGWDAAGLLEALWKRVGGRDRLAEATGIQPATLSGYNTGRLPLGAGNAHKIAEALGVSVLELGAPENAATTKADRRLIDRLRAVEAQAADNSRRLETALQEVTARLADLEAVQAPARRQSTRRKKA